MFQMWFFSLFFYTGFIPFCFSLFFVDITPFTFKGEGEKGVRLIFLDTQRQALRKVYYISPTSTRTKNQTAFENACFKVWFSGDVQLKKTFNKEKMVLQTFGAIDKTTSSLTTLTLPKDAFSLLAQTIKPHFSTGDLKIFFVKGSRKEKRTLTNLSTNINSNKQERGFLGERVTDLFLLTCGFKKKNGQNKSGQGLDGIFFDKDYKTLILSESKCRKESKSALKYMQDDLSEFKIVKRLSEIKDKSLKYQIEDHAEKKVFSVFKLVQRLTATGSIESALVPLDGLLYFFARYPQLKVAPMCVKKYFLSETLRRLDLDAERAYIFSKNNSRNIYEKQSHP